jgi:hypothetical protein
MKTLGPGGCEPLDLCPAHRGREEPRRKQAKGKQGWCWGDLCPGCGAEVCMWLRLLIGKGRRGMYASA